MIPDRTELEWVYKPDDFFEATYGDADTEWTLHIKGGRAVATLTVPHNPVDETLEKRIAAHVETIFRVRNLQAHRPYELEGPRIFQHVGEKKHVTIRLSCAIALGEAHSPDLVLRDAAGKVVRDTKRERVAELDALIHTVAPKATRSSDLRALLEIYDRAVSDPRNELIHLYEVRDALTKYCGGKKHARAKLKISNSEWKRFDHIANEEPLEEGRHRGLHMTGRRNATCEELEEARSIVRKWIEAFARTL